MLFTRTIRGGREFWLPGRDPDAAFDFLAAYERRFRLGAALPAAPAGEFRPDVHLLLEARG